MHIGQNACTNLSRQDKTRCMKKITYINKIRKDMAGRLEQAAALLVFSDQFCVLPNTNTRISDRACGCLCHFEEPYTVRVFPKQQYSTYNKIGLNVFGYQNSPSFVGFD